MMMSDNFIGCFMFILFILFLMAFQPVLFMILLGLAVVLSALAQFIGMFWD